jgi:hypothetical protein
MSGGHFDYVQYKLEDIADEIERIVQENDSNEVNEWGDRIGKNYKEETLYEFMIGVTFILAAATYIRRIDYLLSGDDGEDSFHARLSKDMGYEEEQEES